MKQNFQTLETLSKGTIVSVEYFNQYTNNYIESKDLHFRASLENSAEDYFGIYCGEICLFFITKENFEKLVISKEDENNVTIKYLEMEIYLVLE